MDTPCRVVDTDSTIGMAMGVQALRRRCEANGTTEMNLRFPGQYFDAETKTHYNINRDYNPVTGRYIQSDPIGFDGGVNTFLYVGGNALSGVDKRGLFWDTVLDAVFMVYDVASLTYHTITGNTEAANVDKLALAADAAAAALPFVTGAGVGIRVTKIALPSKLAYTSKVSAQMDNLNDAYHAFPSAIDKLGFEKGVREYFVGGDGIKRIKITLPGKINGEKGVYTWLIEPNGNINHRMFHISE